MQSQPIKATASPGLGVIFALMTQCFCYFGKQTLEVVFVKFGGSHHFYRHRRLSLNDGAQQLGVFLQLFRELFADVLFFLLLDRILCINLPHYGAETLRGLASKKWRVFLG